MGVGETGCYLYRPHAWIARVLQFDRVLVGDQDNGLLYFVNGRRNVGGVVGQGKRGIGVQAVLSEQAKKTRRLADGRYGAQAFAAMLI